MGDDIGYFPEADGEPDPGEVVWAWVPYEEDPEQGKDRPVLLIGTRTPDASESGRTKPTGPAATPSWLALMLTSKDHERDADDEAQYGRFWMDVGAGGWDQDRRPSEVRLDRLLVLDDAAIRREGAALPRAVFDQVLLAAQRFHSVT